MHAKPPEHRPALRRGLIGLAMAVSVVLAAGVVTFLTAGTAKWLGAPSPSPAPSAAGTPSGGVTPSRSCEAVARTESRLARVMKQVGGRTAVGVFDRVTGAWLTVGTGRFRTASTVKVDILAARLLQAQSERTTLTDAERADARHMITRSDNAAASRMWSRIGGGPGLAEAHRKLGLEETTPGYKTYWGTTITTAADQLRLLHAVTDSGGPLTEANRGYILDLMSRVIDQQRWGVTAASTPTSETALKVGRYLFTARSGWTINSIGRIVERRHDWLVAVLSDEHDSQSAGIQAVERVAKSAVDGLRRCPAPA